MTTWLPLAAIAVTVVLWASAFVTIRHAGHEISAGALALGRLVVAGVILGAVVLWRAWRAGTSRGGRSAARRRCGLPRRGLRRPSGARLMTGG